MQQPFYIVPLIVEQPTWGGEYINDFKQITDSKVVGKKIGQAFELFENSYIVREYQEQLPFAFVTAANLTKLEGMQFFHHEGTPETLQAAIDQDPEGVLGKRYLEKNGATMKVLIKFTQAQNNSYQVHVKPGSEFDKWLAKPESWYYFEKGKATLGLREGVDVEEYKKRSLEIDAKAQALSAEIRAGKRSVEQARQQLKDFIDQDHPQRFVNTVFIEPDQVIDLSQGGIHHSWEMGPEAPNGNIVYEVQVNVMDDFCTLRSFDQGNIKDDGNVRQLSIESYFKALDSDPERNRPEQYLKYPETINEAGTRINVLFDNEYYKTTQISFDNVHGTVYSGAYTQTNGSFHHLFVKEGDIEVQLDHQAAGSDKKVWKVPKGWSLFIPASVGSYSIQSTSTTTVLVTSV